MVDTTPVNADNAPFVTPATASVPPADVTLNRDPSRKRQRVEDDLDHSLARDTQDNDGTSHRQHVEGVALATQPLYDIPAAARVMRAVQRAPEKLHSIGICLTKHTAKIEEMLNLNWDSDVCRDSVEEQDRPVMTDEAWRNERRFEKIAEAQKNAACGYLEEQFTLRITKVDCEEVSLIYSAGNASNEHRSDVADKTALHERLKRWFDSALPSGYGDVRAQVTKVDESVRTAREIGPSEFEVEDELLRRIEAIWTERFVPSAYVRAEPYKIHLYGPGGHFKMHRDTPQKDLVGTFLVGLGDTARAGGLVVDGTKMDAHPGVWCAFYPDVPHYVRKVYDGYRAVIAFKIFRAPTPPGMAGENNETAKTAEVRRQVAEVIAQMEAPYGVLLSHKYCLGTGSFNGFDALLADAVQSHSAGKFDVHHFPVVVDSASEWGEYRSDDWDMACRTGVYPLTSGHIDVLNNLLENDGGICRHEDCGSAWLDGVKDVPFYAADLSERSLFPVKHEQAETVNYTGNEAQAWREDSVYLSYALLVLPKAGVEVAE